MVDLRWHANYNSMGATCSVRGSGVGVPVCQILVYVLIYVYTPFSRMARSWLRVCNCTAILLRYVGRALFAKSLALGLILSNALGTVSSFWVPSGVLLCFRLHIPQLGLSSRCLVISPVLQVPLVKRHNGVGDPVISHTIDQVNSGGTVHFRPL